MCSNQEEFTGSWRKRFGCKRPAQVSCPPAGAAVWTHEEPAAVPAGKNVHSSRNVDDGPWFPFTAEVHKISKHHIIMSHPTLNVRYLLLMST